jgi:iron-sulfur cluster assembly protein
MSDTATKLSETATGVSATPTGVSDGAARIGDTAPTDADAALDVTPAAYRRVETLLAREGMQQGALRVGVKGGGCAGYSYVLRLEAGEPRPNDVILSSGNARIYVDPKSARLLAGAVLDFSEGLSGKGFEFRNPNAARTCGCGTSFST